MGIRINVNVARYDKIGEDVSTIFNLPLCGDPLVEFNIVGSNKDAEGRAQVMRYMIFNNAIGGRINGFGLLSAGEDQGVPVFSYRFAADTQQLAEHLSGDGLAPRFIHALSEKMGLPLPVINLEADRHLKNLLNNLLAKPAPVSLASEAARSRVPAILRPLPRKEV